MLRIIKMRSMVRFAILLAISALSFQSYSCKREETPVDTPDDTVTVSKSDINCWLTSPDKTSLLRKQNIGILFKDKSNITQTIFVDSANQMQQMDGFGFTLTGGSATLINHLATDKRDALLRELFSSDSNAIGISYLRISIGASDLSANVFTYNDMPSGETDVDLINFSINPEKADLIPVLKSILAINPHIKILGSPWTAPVWMKNNKNSVGGSLLQQYYPAYANYFVKYVQAMAAEGIPIDAITIQNEPLNPDNNPSMKMLATEQRDFIKNNLGPAFQNAGIKTKILLYDHNCDHPEYATSILDDPAAKAFVDGSAFHLYAGDISALSQVKNAHPDRNLYFTEQWVGGPGNFNGDLQWHIQNLIVGAPRNWSRNVLEWNLASDQAYAPHTNGGCTRCEGALTIGSTITRNVSYYVIAHASKFVPAGSVRIYSDMINGLPNVAFLTPESKKVLIVLNSSSSVQSFNIGYKGKVAITSLNPGWVATYTW